MCTTYKVKKFTPSYYFNGGYLFIYCIGFALCIREKEREKEREKVSYVSSRGVSFVQSVCQIQEITDILFLIVNFFLYCLILWDE